MEPDYTDVDLLLTWARDTEATIEVSPYGKGDGWGANTTFLSAEGTFYHYETPRVRTPQLALIRLAQHIKETFNSAQPER